MSRDTQPAETHGFQIFRIGRSTSLAISLVNFCITLISGFTTSDSFILFEYFAFCMQTSKPLVRVTGESLNYYNTVSTPFKIMSTFLFTASFHR